MPLTLVVWSARPIQPLMRMLVRPQGERARQDGREIAEREPDQRVMRIEDGDDDLADLALGDGIAGAGPHDLDDDVLVDDQALRAPRVS